MGFRFYGGPYDGREIDRAEINRHASIYVSAGDLGVRAFAFMPPPESWDKLVRGEAAETNPIYAYERVSTSEGERFDWPISGALDKAILEAKLKVHPRAKSALSALPDDLRKSTVDIVCELQRSDPDYWPNDLAARLSGDMPTYLVRLPRGMRAFVRVLDSGELELFDIVREDTLRLFMERYSKVSLVG